MLFNSRLLEVIKYSGKNTTKFGSDFQTISAENIRQLSKKDNANPSLSFLEEILVLYPEIDAKWLLTGKGTMLNDSKKYQLDIEKDMVNEHGEHICYKCYAKDGQINMLKEQLHEKEQKIDELNQMVENYKTHWIAALVVIRETKQPPPKNCMEWGK